MLRRTARYKRRKPIYKRVWVWILAFIVVIGIGVRIAADPLAERFTQKALDNLEGYRGQFSDVSVSFIPPGYAIHDLKIEQEKSRIKDPLVYIEDLDARVDLSRLLSFQLVGKASAYHAKFAMGLSTPPKPPKKEAGKEKKEKKAAPEEIDVADTLYGLIPFRVDRVELREGEFLLVDDTEPRRPQLWISNVELAIENIATRRSLDKNVPIAMTMRATAQKSGTFKMMANIDALAGEKPAFTGQAELIGLELKHVHDFVAAKTGLAAKGTLDTFINFNSADGKLSGAIKLMLKNPKLVAADDKLVHKLEAKLGNVGLRLFSDRVEGRNALATTLPIKGTLENPSPQIWPAVLGVVRNAFVEGLSWGFAGVPMPTAGEKEGKLEQASDALDKDEAAPKAQPNG